MTEHLIKNGNERVVEETRDHMRRIRALTDFNFYEGPIDRGSGVREKSKNVIELVGDNDRIREERAKARELREKFQGSGGGSSTPYGGFGGSGSGGSRGGGGGGGYGGYPSGSYSSGGIGSSSFDQRRPVGDFGGTRQGSGRYDDSGGSGGYRDSGSGHSGNSGNGRYSDEAPPAAPAPAAPKEKSGQKFSIKIKSASGGGTAAPAAAPPAAPAVPEPDLFGVSDSGGDFFGSSASAAPTSDFDSFSSAPVAALNATAAPDAFGGGFTDFASSAPAAPPPQSMAPPYGQFPAGMPMGMQSMGMPMGQSFLHQLPAAPPQGFVASQGFSDFASAPVAMSAPPPAQVCTVLSQHSCCPQCLKTGLTQQGNCYQDGFGDFQAPAGAPKPAVPTHR